MLSPEVWNFKPPLHHLSEYTGSSESHQKITKEIRNHYFNHSVTVILPDTVLVPEYFNTTIVEDSIYYKIEHIPLQKFVHNQFIDSFVKQGQLWALSADTHIDTDNCAAITPSGHLVLNLDKETYQTLGLEGTQSQFSTERYGSNRPIVEWLANFLIMPQKCQPARLELLAQEAVGEWVKMVGQGLMEPVYLMTQRDPNCGLLFLQHSLDYIRETLFATLPWYLFDEVAVQVLTSISQLINETKSGYNNYIPMAAFLNKMKVAVHLTEIVMHPQLKKIIVSDWPKIMRHVLNQNLSKLVGLETLDLGSGSSGMDTTETEKYILSGVQWMSNLTTFSLCFDCTHTIISVLSRSCPHLQRLDVTSSKSVTDRSVPFLLNCKKLLTVQLYRTSVSAKGYMILLLEHSSIQDFGRCDEFGKVLHLLKDNDSDPLPIKYVQCRDLKEEHLRLLVKYFPRLTGISMFHNERVADLTVLSELTDLKDLKILNCDFFSDLVKQLLNKVGLNLKTLHLEHVDEIDLNALICISQFCPNLKSLSFYNCEFADHALLDFNPKKLAVEPFSVLENLKCVSDCGLVHLEFMMIYCKNIKFIQLGSSTGVSDETMSRVLGQNPMKTIEELRILYSHNLSMQTVQLLMSHCDRLHTLSELESWDGISSSELHDFREYIRKNNIKLDTRPTLSY